MGFKWIYRSSRPNMCCKKGVLRNFIKFTGKHLCQSLFFNKLAGLRPQACKFIKKETLAQVFSCEFYEISKNTFLHTIPPVAAAGSIRLNLSDLSDWTCPIIRLNLSDYERLDIITHIHDLEDCFLEVNFSETRNRLFISNCLLFLN